MFRESPGVNGPEDVRPDEWSQAHDLASERLEKVKEMALTG